MSMRRLLVVSDEMEVGGSQRQIVHLLRGIDHARWQPTLLYFRNRSFLVDELETAGVRCIHLPKHGRISPGFVWSLWRFLRRERFDVIHAFSLTGELWVRALLPLLPATRFIASVRGLCLGYPDWQWTLKRWILGRADAVIANARAGAGYTSQRTGYPLERIDVVANGIDVDQDDDEASLASVRHGLALPADRVVALFVGRLVVEKNVPLLLDAMARIEASKRPLLLLAGDGPLAASIDARIAELRLGGDVRRLGERGDTRALMQLADLLVMPSREEGLSNVILEAMASGLAVLASDVGGNPELVEDDCTGWLFRSGNATELAAKLQVFAEDPDLRRRIGDAARRQAVDRYSVASLVAGTESIYRRVVAGDGVKQDVPGHPGAANRQKQA